MSFYSYYIDEDELDLNIEDEFDLDLELDIDDNIDDIETESDNEKFFKLQGEFPFSYLSDFSHDFAKKIKLITANPEKLKELKKELTIHYIDELKNFLLLNYPFKKSLRNCWVFRTNYICKELLSEEQIEKLKGIDFEKATFSAETKFPIYYADEWLEFVSYGNISISAGEDISHMKKKSSPVLEKKSIIKKIENMEKNIHTLLKNRNDDLEKFKKLSDDFLTTGGDIKNIKDLSSNVEKITPIIVAINNYGLRLKSLAQNIKELQKKLDKSEVNNMPSDETQEDMGDLLSEFSSIRDMCKMATGPRGNHFPFLTGEYFPVFINNRDKIKNLIKDFYNLLPDFFYRKFLGIETNKVPYVLLAPCYGNNGFCWEAIDSFNKETGRGKVVIPLYSQKKPEELVAEGLGDYYWQKSKASAGSRWLEEGITGKYYMYHQDLKVKKKKGKDVKVISDLKESFLFHFKKWVLEERIARMKLPKEVRLMFYFNIPFDYKTKEKLGDTNFTYKNLFENEQRKRS
ncbi:MAG: hypothetical protein ACQESP_08610 [Candidatus Muiribacteriota bacterium]